MKNIVIKKQKGNVRFLITCIILSAISIALLSILLYKINLQNEDIHYSKYNNNKLKSFVSSGRLSKGALNLKTIGNKITLQNKSGVSNATNVNKASDPGINNVVQAQMPNYGIKASNAFVEDGKKTAYLTFDDGPSTTVTPRILDTLKQNNIHATFFLVGHNIQMNNQSINLVKRIYTEGNSIGNHTYSHDLRKLYPHNMLSIDSFMHEISLTDSILKNILGQSFSTSVIRMPGGYMSRVFYKDPNLKSFDNILKDHNMFNIDWNAYDFDAEGKWKNQYQLFQNVKNTVAGKNKVVILMHDTYGKEETAKALPSIIQYLKSQGYEFKTLY